MFAAFVLATILSASPSPAPVLRWRAWGPGVFEEAGRTHKPVLLNLEAVWCHWCHVMDAQTYADPAVVREVQAHFLAVRVDQDSRPDLAARYERWGWPATIVFGPDGTERLRQRGFVPPEELLPKLRAARQSGALAAAPSESLPPSSLQPSATLHPAAVLALDQRLDDVYDVEHGGWGTRQRLLDGDVLEYTLYRCAHGAPGEMAKVQKTLLAARQLLDPVWGGLYQYSEALDWSRPHFEKLLSVQAEGLKAYAFALGRSGAPEWRRAGGDIHRYVEKFLLSPEGAFEVSQDADLSPSVQGRVYYALPEAQRRKLGIPHVDAHLYARENGWMVAALCAWFNVAHDTFARDEAVRAAQWVLVHRRAPDGGFRHEALEAPPTLADNLAMAQAFEALYASTGDRSWLTLASQTLAFIQARFGSGPKGGYIAAAPEPGVPGVLSTPVRSVDDNAQLARLANLHFHASGEVLGQQMADAALAYVRGVSRVDPQRITPQAVLADVERREAPLHVTVVGSKSDANARALYEAALGFPSSYLLVEWLDRHEGPLPHEVPAFPELNHAAGYVCHQRSCSLPLTSPQKLREAMARE